MYATESPGHTAWSIGSAEGSVAAPSPLLLGNPERDELRADSVHGSEPLRKGARLIGGQPGHSDSASAESVPIRGKLQEWAQSFADDIGLGH